MLRRSFRRRHALAATLTTVSVRTTRALSSSSLRVATYNIHAWRDSAHADNLDRVCDCLREVDADVVCLNEVLHPYALDEMDVASQALYLRAVQDGAMRRRAYGPRVFWPIHHSNLSLGDTQRSSSDRSSMLSSLFRTVCANAGSFNSWRTANRSCARLQAGAVGVFVWAKSLS